MFADDFSSCLLLPDVYVVYVQTHNLANYVVTKCSSLHMSVGLLG